MPLLERPACVTFAPIRAPIWLCLAGAYLALASCRPATQFDYAHLPAGYHWRGLYDRATHTVVFYGRDPLTHATVYVGPDNRFFTFHHPGPIGPKDLTTPWIPHDAP
ncbi:MAG: hypothetical protein WBE77_01850 [Candidatus Cybelea sp.]